MEAVDHDTHRECLRLLTVNTLYELLTYLLTYYVIQWLLTAAARQHVLNAAGSILADRSICRSCWHFVTSCSSSDLHCWQTRGHRVACRPPRTQL